MFVETLLLLFLLLILLLVIEFPTSLSLSQVDFVLNLVSNVKDVQVVIKW